MKPLVFIKTNNEPILYALYVFNRVDQNMKYELVFHLWYKFQHSHIIALRNYIRRNIIVSFINGRIV